MKATRTRQHIIGQAAPVFNKKGFAGTSLADLEEVTGLTRGALYGHFPDKESIAAEAFAHATGTVKTLMRRALKPCITNKEKLFALLEFFARYVLTPPVPGGCPLLNSAIEADDHRLSMRRVVTREILQVVTFIETLLKKGIRAGEFKRDTNARELAYIFFCAIEGAIMFSRVEASSEPMDIIVDHCKNKLEQISNPLWNKNG